MPTRRLLILLLMLATTIRAELTLGVPAIELKPKPEDEEVEAVFKFRNAGDKPVKVLSLESACSCLSAELDKAEYQPGEEGTGTARFKVSTFVGRHEKYVIATTNDPDQEEWQINFILDVPTVVEIKPKTLQWYIGDESSPKSCLVQFTGEDPTKIVKITATRENVAFEWKELKEGREYLVTVTPKTTDDVTLGALKIETNSPIAKYRNQLAFFSISRKPDLIPAPQP